jgi:hypothetical protein
MSAATNRQAARMLDQYVTSEGLTNMVENAVARELEEAAARMEALEPDGLEVSEQPTVLAR